MIETMSLPSADVRSINELRDAFQTEREWRTNKPMIDTPESDRRFDPDQAVERECVRYGIDRVTAEKLVAETSWVRVEEFPTVPREQAEQIGLGKIPCPMCQSRCVRLRVQGETTGMLAYRTYVCRCSAMRRFFPRLAALRAAYRNYRLYSLKSHMQSRITTVKQKEVIADIQANPGRSYLIVGPASTSKTVYSSALYAHALYAWADAAEPGAPDACWYVSAYDLCNQAVEWATQRESTYTDEIGQVRHRAAQEPVVTTAKIMQAAKVADAAEAAGASPEVVAALRPKLYIEELDKVKTTEYKEAFLFELINCIDGCKGQVVVTSNLSAADLQKMYSAKDGEAFVRRFTASNATGDGKVWDFFGHCRPLGN